MKRRQRQLLVAAGALIAVAVVIYLLRAPILTAVGRSLVARDELVPADAIFLLNGDIDSRPAGAADLFLRGFAPAIVIAREEDTSAMRAGLMPNQTEAAVALLARFGVPDSAVVVEQIPGGVTSTLDEAHAFRQYVERARPRRVILVTNDFHSRRSRWTLRRTLRSYDVDVLVHPVRHRHFDATDWWRSEAGLILHLEEFIKFAFYLLRA